MTKSRSKFRILEKVESISVSVLPPKRLIPVIDYFYQFEISSYLNRDHILSNHKIA